MKKFNQIFAALVLMLSIAQFSNAQVTVLSVQDSISTDTHWTNDKQYLIKGYVYVTNNATLTIDPGVIIKGDKNSKGALIIERGSKINAVGTVSQPIVFTSNQPAGQRSYGDWGGVILCGKAPNNWAAGVQQVEGGPRSLYGGTDPHDNSGALSYVRIEFAGIAFSANNEVNGLTFCSVGDATQVDHIQVSYSGDDAYEWFGGTVNTKYLVAFRTWDDDFDTDNGYSGLNQYGVALRDPLAADQSGSKTWESDSYGANTITGLVDASAATKAVFTNYTAIGPLLNPGTTTYDPQYIAGAQIRRGSALSLLNTIISGYPTGILIDESSVSYGSTIANMVSGLSQIKGVAVAGIPTTSPSPKEVFFVYDGARNLTSTAAWGDTILHSFAPFLGPWNWFTDTSNHNTIYANEQNGLRLQTPYDLVHPNFIPTSTSPVVYNASHAFNSNNPINTDTSNNYHSYNVPALSPVLNSSKLNNPFFTVENHVGAFKYTGSSDDNWTAGWCNWDPSNTDYSALSTDVQNYDADKLYLRVSPNPAVNQALVGYRIQETGNIEISLFDMLGNKVKEVYNGNATPGEYAYPVNTSELNSGIYFINVKTTNAQQSIKLMVAK